MANQEHLDILNQGVDVWNKWRKENPEITPDFSWASLTDANLIGADLTGANLINAQLHLANLFMADLIGADLTEAFLSMSNLTWANLTKANLTNAVLFETVFGETNFGGAIGLETCVHNGPSVIDHRTIQKSWPLPEVFLRGCGVPDRFIEYLPSLVNDPIQFYSCFISYSSKDQEFAERLHADLQAKGVRCWFAPEDLKTGDKFRSVIDDAIRVNDKVLLVLSGNSINSDWVEDEVESAFAKERGNKTVLFPIQLDDSVTRCSKAWVKKVHNTRHITDFTAWKDHKSYKKSFDRLLRDLKVTKG